MSLSNTAGKLTTGRVIIGLQTRGLDEINAEARDAVRIATPENEEKFMERVRARAKQKATEIINQALAEARDIKSHAFEEGHRSGLSKAEEEIAAQKDELSASLAKIFDTLKQEKRKIWTEHRQDIAMVLKASLDKILAIELEANKIDVMSNLLEQALEQAECSKSLTLTVSAKDEKIMRELLEKARQKRPEMASCRLKASKKVSKGGLILENGNGMVDNTIESRYKQIKEIVDQLSLEEESA